MSEFWVNGIVSSRNKLPYIQLSNENGMIVQLSMAQARNIAMDILVMCARTEADAMIHQFFEASQFPSGASEALMVAFRDFRAQLDDEVVERGRSDPHDSQNGLQEE